MDATRTNDAAYDAAVRYAADLGAEHGRNAASWYLQDHAGTQTTAYIVLRGIEDGDPEILDTLPAPDLSGQWADSLTGPVLAEDAVRDALYRLDLTTADGSDDWAGEWFSDICAVYEAAFEQAAADTIESVARAMVESEVEE